MAYYSTKTYGHQIGLSAVFRQPNADHSHCHLLHGYSLAFKFTFGCSELDNKNWAVDFGGLKPLKAWLEDNFDHKLALDADDPYLEKFQELEALDLAEIRIFDGVGTERFAFHAWKFADELIRKATDDRCWCESVECAEHGANSAIYKIDPLLRNDARPVVINGPGMAHIGASLEILDITEVERKSNRN